MKTLKTINKEFDDNFVHFHIWNDMHNQPILHNTDFDDIDSIKSFISSQIKELLWGLMPEEKNATWEQCLSELQEKIKKIINE